MSKPAWSASRTQSKKKLRSSSNGIAVGIHTPTLIPVSHLSPHARTATRQSDGFAVEHDQDKQRSVEADRRPAPGVKARYPGRW